MEKNKDKVNNALDLQSILGKIIYALKQYGPGIAMVLSMMGAGDLIISATYGSDYQYSYLWLLAFSLIIRAVILNIVGRYQIQAPEGNTILDGYTSISKFFPYFIAAGTAVALFVYSGSLIKGVAEILHWFIPALPQTVWAIVTIAGTLFLVLGKNVYNKMERFMKVCLAILTVSFVGLAISSKPDLGALAKGLLFGIPDGQNGTDVFLLAAGLIGAVAGSIANLLYAYFLRDKGWTKIEYRKLQINDLRFSIICAIVIDLTIWIVGAEILHPNNIKVESVRDIAMALQLYMGHLGSIIIYVGAFALLYTTLVGLVNGYTKIIVDGIYKARGITFGKGQQIEGTKLYKILVIFYILAPFVLSMPGMPGFAYLVILSNALTAFMLPVVAVGILLVSNDKNKMGNLTNNWIENGILALTTVLSVYISYQTIVGFFA